MLIVEGTTADLLWPRQWKKAGAELTAERQWKEQQM
jgi:uncharacterized protein YjeT (DUF2065 family)